MRSVTLLYRKFVAIVAASLLAAGPSRPKAIPLGTVTQAEQAHLGATEASVGSTIYDGDRLSTDSGGVLRASGIALTLQLDSNSSVTLRGAPVPEGDIQAELGSGTVIFSSGQASNIAVLADGALIRPAAHAFTVAHIRVTSPKELRIYAQRGALDFSYHGQSAVILEGTAYRVLLDPSEREIDAAAESGRGRNPPAKGHVKFLLLTIGIAAGGAIAMMRHRHHMESPDRP